MPDLDERTLSHLQARVHQALRQRHSATPSFSRLAPLLLSPQIVRESSITPHQAAACLRASDDPLHPVVEVDLRQRRDTIRKLTRSFLHEQVLRWQ